MKKIYFIAALVFGILATNYAQELVVGGDMESADSWTIVDLAVGDGHTETFGYLDDSPSGGFGGCLSLAGLGNWSNVAVCQEITISRGSSYQISMVVKTSMDFIPDAQWVEIVVVDTMPVEDGDITSFPNSFALNSWDCSDVLFVDGEFAENNCDAKSDLMDIINIEGEGDTTVVLVLKAGGGSEYNVLLDEVSVMEISGTAVQNTINSTTKLFPNPFSNELSITSTTSIREIDIVNMVGQSVYHQTNLEGTSHTVDLQDVTSGIYCVLIKDQNGNTAVSKTIKK